MSLPQAPTAFATPVIAPNAGSAYRRANYISPTLYRAKPTAVATTQLIPGDATANDNTNALTGIISEASDWIDDHVFHLPDGCFAASPVVESDWIKVKDNGQAILICNFKPVKALLGIMMGPSPSTMTSLNSGQDISIRGKTIELPPNWYGQLSGFNFPVPTWRGGVYALWQYISGFPHLTLTSTANSGSNSLQVANAVPGSLIFDVFPGSLLTIHDGVKEETVVVGSSYVPGATTLPLTSSLIYTHTPPAATTSDIIHVSGLPEAVIRSTIAITSALLKTRGTRAQVMPTTGGNKANNQALSQAGAFDDVDLACKLLRPYRTVYLHA